MREGGAKAMNDIQAAKALGLFSLGLGAIEIILGRRVNRDLGLELTPGAVRAFGAREIVSGSLVLLFPDKAAPMWIRVAGDVLDLAVLSRALSPGHPRRQAALVAMLAVVGVTILDVATASALTKRHTRALSTARRTRVQRA